MHTDVADQVKVKMQRRVESWNRSVKVGAKVTYLKSELEGRIILKTVQTAYLFEGEPAVDLEHIGVALLSKVETFYE